MINSNVSRTYAAGAATAARARARLARAAGSHGDGGWGVGCIGKVIGGGVDLVSGWKSVEPGGKKENDAIEEGEVCSYTHSALHPPIHFSRPLATITVREQHIQSLDPPRSRHRHRSMPFRWRPDD